MYEPIELVGNPGLRLGRPLVDGETFWSRRLKLDSDVRDIEGLPWKRRKKNQMSYTWLRSMNRSRMSETGPHMRPSFPLFSNLPFLFFCTRKKQSLVGYGYRRKNDRPPRSYRHRTVPFRPTEEDARPPSTTQVRPRISSVFFFKKSN